MAEGIGYMFPDYTWYWSTSRQVSSLNDDSRMLYINGLVQERRNSSALTHRYLVLLNIAMYSSVSIICIKEMKCFEMDWKHITVSRFLLVLFTVDKYHDTIIYVYDIVAINMPSAYSMV